MFAFTLTDAAAQKLEALLENDQATFLRVAIKGGGCAGFAYDFSLETLADEYDHVFSHAAAQGPVNVLIDPVSAAYLDGATLDYQRQMLSEQFVLSNPRAKATCGCGLSFSG